MIAAFLAHLRATGKAENTILSYRNDLRRLPQDRAPTTADLLAYAHGIAGKPATRARKVASARSYCRWLGAQAPSRWDKALSYVKVPPQPVRVLSEREVSALLGAPSDTIEGARDAAMLRLLRATGISASQLVRLDRDDWAGEYLRVVHRGRERFLPLDARTEDALRAYLDGARPALMRGHGDTPALFVNLRERTRLTRQGAWLILKGYARPLGLGWISPHTLRATFARGLEDADARDVQTLLGHRNLATTLRYRRRAA